MLTAAWDSMNVLSTSMPKFDHTVSRSSLLPDRWGQSTMWMPAYSSIRSWVSYSGSKVTDTNFTSSSILSPRSASACLSFELMSGQVSVQRVKMKLTTTRSPFRLESEKLSPFWSMRMKSPALPLANGVPL